MYFVKKKKDIPNLFYFSSANKRQKEIFEMCKEKALQSDMRSKHCACLVRNGKIINMECNQYSSDKNSHSLHAEPLLHKKSMKQYKIRKNYIYDLYVVRYSEASGFMNSKPCMDCIKYIKLNMNYINKVIYSVDNKTYIKENKELLSTEHMSHGYSHLRQQKRKLMKK